MYMFYMHANSYMFYLPIHLVFLTNTCCMNLQMPRHRRSTYRPPTISGTSGGPDAGSPSGGYDIGGSSQSQVPETPTSSSVGTSPMFGDLSSDGCPYTVLTPGATWNGKPVLFPNGKK